MNRKTIFKAAVVASCSIAALSLFQCSQAPSVIAPPGGGGISGAAGTLRKDAAVAGSVGTDAPPVNVNLDLRPLWWGESDAQEPDLPPPPSVDSNCGIISSNTVRKPADILLVLDRSASMDWSITEDCYCSAGAGNVGMVCEDTTDCKTRWEAMEPAVNTTLANSKNVNWGLKFFPTGSSGNCNVSSSVEVQVGPDTAADVQQQIDTTDLALSTPTAAAITVATDYLKSLPETNDKFILVATDGEPNCGGSPPSIRTDDVDGAAAAAAAAKDAGFPVYVVGIGPNLGNLTNLAEAGGTTDYYQVNSPEDLVEALSAISKIVGSCTFTASEEPPDPENVAVYVNKQKVEQSDTDGWKYGASTMEIELTGSYCEGITSGEVDTSVQILFGCPGSPPFPPFVP